VLGVSEGYALWLITDDDVLITEMGTSNVLTKHVLY
jgi:branched-subunit amino acid aminotransferase/4-amino-4-deoxychorismate lyase